MPVPELTKEVVETSEAVEIRLSGSFDERVTLEPIETGGKKVVIDCAGIHRINSRGVALWCKLIEELAHRGPVHLRRVSPPMVTAASLIKSFFRGATVDSYQSPWTCVACKEDHVLLHPAGEAPPKAPECPSCSAVMEFDGLPESYRIFVD